MTECGGGEFFSCKRGDDCLNNKEMSPAPLKVGLVRCTLPQCGEITDFRGTFNVNNICICIWKDLSSFEFVHDTNLAHLHTSFPYWLLASVLKICFSSLYIQSIKFAKMHRAHSCMHHKK